MSKEEMEEKSTWRGEREKREELGEEGRRGGKKRRILGGMGEGRGRWCNTYL